MEARLCHDLPPLPSLSTKQLEALLLTRLTVRRRVAVLRELRERAKGRVRREAVPVGLVEAVMKAAV